MQILHNPRCSKSRDSFNWLTENGHEFETIEYLKTPPTKLQLQDLLKKLGMTAEELIRKGEPDFKDNFKGKTLTETEWIQAMMDFPKLIERPIVVKGDKAVVGRPLEKVISLVGETE